MAKYVVTYTIKDDSKRESFVKELEKVGLSEFNDQSVHYGSYNGNKSMIRFSILNENLK